MPKEIEVTKCPTRPARGYISDTLERSEMKEAEVFLEDYFDSDYDAEFYYEEGGYVAKSLFGTKSKYSKSL